MFAIGVAAALAVGVLGAPAWTFDETGADAAAETRTDWVVRPAPGLDALLMIGAASGDVLAQNYYGETIAFLRERMPAESVAAMDRIDHELRVERGRLVGPSLVYIFSVAPAETLEDVLASARDPEGRLRPGLSLLANWDEARFQEAVEMMPDVVLALEGLQAIDYSDWHAAENLPRIEQAITRNQAAVSPYDIIPEQERLLGTPLEDEVQILLVRFSLPYGIRITGQRFLVHYNNPAHIQLQVAAHEIFHPPFDIGDETLWSRLETLESDPWMVSILDNHDPAYGYNTFRGIVNEDSTQALDQIVSERLGFARDAGQRWASHDGGMHMFAAALYQAMREDGFAESGGRYEDWLKSALDRGLLTPAEVRRRAALIVGEAPVQLWYDAMETDVAD
jgi:hypothetical protein